VSVVIPAHNAADTLGALEHADFVGGATVTNPEDLPRWARRHDGIPHGQWELWSYDERVLYPIGASMGARRSVLDTAGGFDETFAGAAGEDTDMAIRLLRAGFRVGYSASATVNYRPRSDMRSIVAQRTSSLRGLALIAQREGTTEPQRKEVGDVERALRRLGGVVIKQRNLRPAVLLAEAQMYLGRYRERREPAGPLGEPYGDPAGLDFVVPLDVDVIGGLGLTACRNSAIWYANGGVEKLSIRLMTRLLSAGAAMIDVGADIGTFSAAAALTVGDRGRVFSFEPDQVANRLLVENLHRHHVDDRSDARLCVVADGTGDVPFDVHTVSLDDAVSGSVDLIKIDMNGFELRVLQDARQLLARNPQAMLLVKLDPAALAARRTTVGAFLAELASYRPALWLIEEAAAGGRVRAITREVANEIEGVKRDWRANVLAAPVEMVDLVQQAINGSPVPHEFP